MAASGITTASRSNIWRLGAWATPRVLTLDALAATDSKPFVCDAFKDLLTANVKVVGVELQVTVSVSPIPFVNWSHSKSILFEADSNGSDKFQWHELAIGEAPHFPQSSMQVTLVPEPNGAGHVEGHITHHHDP